MSQADEQLNQDIDPQETREWLDTLAAVINADGPERAHFLLEQMVDLARRSGGYLPYQATTAYVNTIPPHLEKRSDGDQELENRIRAMVRWNAMAMVIRTNRRDGGLGGHWAVVVGRCAVCSLRPRASSPVH